MGVTMKTYSSKAEWEKGRGKYIGGSDCACIIGESPWKTNVRLWEEKTGRVIPTDISKSPVVKFGVDSEAFLRGLFANEHPEYDVSYEENNSWMNDRYPWARASLDGWTQNGSHRGILEIKTADVVSHQQRQKWEGNNLPQNYFCQVLFYMAVTEADYADVFAYLRHYDIDGTKVKTYHIERKDHEDDIRYLMQECAKFYSCIETDTVPPLRINI